MVDYVVPHNPEWTSRFTREVAALQAALMPLDVTFHHIGSTAIPGIRAKPIVDLLGETNDLEAIDARSDTFRHLGYEIMGEYGIEQRRYFRKFNGDGVRTHHVHIFEMGSPHAVRHLAFRDYLRAHSECAAAYSELKARLSASDNLSWDDYVDGKSPFIRATEQAALKWYRGGRQGKASLNSETSNDKAMSHPFEDPNVARVFDTYPSEARRGLLQVRDLIFDVAARTEGVGRLLETLKWGQPAYLTPEKKSGTTIRLGAPKSGGMAVYVHCQTSIISDFKTVFPDEFVYEGNRAVLFASAGDMAAEKLEILIRSALTYHRR